MGRASTESCSLGSQGALVLRFIVLASCITLLVVLFMGHDGGKVSSSSSSATKEVIHFTVANLSPKDSHIRPVIPPRAAVDLGLNKEGIRLELAKTSKTFNSGFCDVLVDPQDFTPAGGGEDGGAVCSAARLYLADNKDDKSDRILDFAMKHESEFRAFNPHLTNCSIHSLSMQESECFPHPVGQGLVTQTANLICTSSIMPPLMSIHSAPLQVTSSTCSLAC